MDHIILSCGSVVDLGVTIQSALQSSLHCFLVRVVNKTLLKTEIKIETICSRSKLRSRQKLFYQQDQDILFKIKTKTNKCQDQDNCFETKTETKTMINL